MNDDEMSKAMNTVDFQKGLLEWMEASAGIYGFADGLTVTDKLGILSTSIVDVCMKNDMDPELEFMKMAHSAHRMNKVKEAFKGLIDLMKGACKDEEDTDTI